MDSKACHADRVDAALIAGRAGTRGSGPIAGSTGTMEASTMARASTPLPTVVTSAIWIITCLGQTGALAGRAWAKALDQASFVLRDRL